MINTTPHNLEIEIAVLGLALFNTETANEVLSVCTIDDFYSGDHQTIFKAIKKQIDDTNTIDAAILGSTITKELNNPHSFFKVADNYSDYNFAGKIEELKKYSKLRNVKNAAFRILEDIENGSEISTILNNAERDLFLLTEKSENDAKRIDEFTEFVTNNYSKFSHTQYKTGLFEIDKRIMLHDGLMFIIAGAPGSGKTSLATNFLLELSYQSAIPTGLFSQETSGEMINYRLGHTYGGNSFDGYRKGAHRLKEVPLYIDDTPGLTMNRLRAKALRMVKRHKVKLFAIDYLQLMNGEGENQNVRVGNLSKGITALAKETKTCWIVLSQLTKEGLKKEEPGLADLRDSGQIAQDARGVYFLFPSREYENALTFKCEKQNFGQAHWRTDISFDKGRNFFSTLKKEQATPLTPEFPTF